MKFFSNLKSSTDFYTQIALVLILVLLVNLVFTFAPWRVDVTEAHVYSVSSVTKQTLAQLDDLITIKAYFTKDLPGYLITVRNQVKDILAEYKNYGKGNIQIKFINPNESTELEQEAQRLGLPPLRFNVVKKDKLEVAQGYLGIAVLYGDHLETIPVVQNISNLEFDLTAAIKKVVAGKTLTVGILQKENVLTKSSDLESLKEVLAKQYRVEFVDLSKDKNLALDNITTLIVPGPVADLTSQELYLIDQFVMSGRGVFFAVDGVTIEQGLVAKENKSNIFDLLNSYGINIKKNLIYDSRYSGQASFTSGFVQFFTPYGFWPKILSNGFNQENVLVNKLESVVLPWVSNIESKENTIVLARTSEHSKLVKENFNLDPQSQPVTFGAGNYATAIFTDGALKSYFKDNTNLADFQSVNADFIDQTDSSRLAVVSDADLLTNGFLARFEGNLVFVQNLIDGLTLDQDLAAIRSKSVTERPIAELDNTSRQLVKYGNVVGVPVLVILFAIFKFIWRKKAQRLEEERY